MAPRRANARASLDRDFGLELGDDELEELVGKISAAAAETGEEPPGA